MTGYDPREEKLPLWARNTLRDARAKQEKAEERLAAAEQTMEPTHIWYGEYNHPIYIPRPYGYQTVYFQLDETRPVGQNDTYTAVQVRLKDGRVEINGGQPLKLELQSSNTFHVELIRNPARDA